MIKVSNDKFNKQFEGDKKLEAISAVALSILPIFSPYSFIGAISINMIILGITTLLILISSRGKFNNKLPVAIMLLWTTHSILSLISAYTIIIDISLINSLILTSFNILCMVLLWSNCNFNIFTRYANYFGLISCVFIFVQAYFLAIGLNPPSGRLFNLELLDSATFVSTTWGFRLNSIFQEPSYFAIYVLPLLAVNLRRNNFKVCLIYILALILSSSSLGIIGAIIVIINYLLIEKKNIKEFIIITILILIVHLILYHTLNYYSSSFNRSISKIMLIPQNSSIRFTGQISLFNHLPFINQLIGVGINQMENYFSQIFTGIYNYSNSFIITLINTGIIGLLAYIIFIFHMLYISWKSDKLIFMLIFMMVASTDYFIYNFFFFYLLTFINL